MYRLSVKLRMENSTVRSQNEVALEAAGQESVSQAEGCGWLDGEFVPPAVNSRRHCPVSVDSRMDSSRSLEWVDVVDQMAVEMIVDN